MVDPSSYETQRDARRRHPSRVLQARTFRGANAPSKNAKMGPVRSIRRVVRRVVGEVPALSRNVLHDEKTRRSLVRRCRGKTVGQIETVTATGIPAQMRRTRAVLLTHRKLRVFLDHSHSKDIVWLMQQGRYRSLMRRSLSYSKLTLQKLDLRQREGQPFNHLKAFAALDRHIYGRLRRTAPQVKIQHDPRCVSWADTLFQNVGINDEELLTDRWLCFDAEAKKNWPYLLIYLLHHVPGEALLFLRLLHRTTSFEVQGAVIVVDALEHLAKLHTKKLYVGDSWKPKDKISWNRLMIVPTFYHIVSSHLQLHRGICSQELLLNIAKLATIKDLKIVFDLVTETRTNMVYDTVLHYANTFALAGEHEYALLCLRRFARKTVDIERSRMLVNRERFRWTCALIIRKSMVKEGNYHETTGIVAALVNLGVQMDISLYNTVISNSMEAGDYATAFRVYNSLADNNLKPDKHTFSILLHGCTKTKEPAKFRDFAEYCAQKAREFRDPLLATNYLYYLYICLEVKFAQSEDRVRHALEQLSRAYTQFFSIAPLGPFWSQPRLQSKPTKNNASASSTVLMEPPPLALYVMLQTEIRYAATISDGHVWNMYEDFNKLIQGNEHVVLNKLAQDPEIWNAFLFAFCRKQQFAYASKVIQDMTERSPQPNIYSWNMFMQEFFKIDQVQAAERVLEIMRSRGVEPNQYTYRTLLRGYAKAQNIAKIKTAMERVDNEHTMGGTLLTTLARIQERKRLMVAMERGRRKKEEREKQEAAAVLAMERERWKPPSFSPVLAVNSESLPQFGSVLKGAVLRVPATTATKAEEAQSTGDTINTKARVTQSQSILPSPVESPESNVGNMSMSLQKWT
jgi:pentatricopeptide repeat protein